MSESVSDVVASVRQQLGATGVWTSHLRFSSADDSRLAAQRFEELGYGSVWTGEVIGGKDIFVQGAIVLAATSRIVFGTGIANVWARHPAATQGAANTVGAAWPGRFINGIGVSHSAIVDQQGQTYVRPLARMRAYVDDMDRASPSAPTTPVPVPRLLAALGPKMLELAREKADGAHPYLVPRSHTALARTILGPDRLLIPELKVLLCSDATTARRIARRRLSTYLRLPNYARNLSRLGLTDEDLAGPGSDRLVDSLVAWGDDQAIAARIRELHEDGADHVVIQPLTDDLGSAVAMLERLAPAVLSS